MSKKMGIVLVSFALIAFCAQASLADDGLSLTGVVKSVDSATGMISVDVTSEGCRGVRTFKVPDTVKGDLNASFVGKKLNFKIDGVICERGRIYNIIF